MYDTGTSDTNAKIQNFSNAVDGQFGRVWNYQCKDHAIDICFSPGFFASMRSNLMFGDVIRLVRVIRGRAVAYCEGMVCEANDKDVDFRMISQSVLYFSERDDFKEVIEPIEKTEPPAYIKGEGKMAYNVGKGKFDIKVKGKVVAEADNKDTAERIIRGDLPIVNVVDRKVVKKANAK